MARIDERWDPVQDYGQQLYHLEELPATWKGRLRACCSPRRAAACGCTALLALLLITFSFHSVTRTTHKVHEEQQPFAINVEQTSSVTAIPASRGHNASSDAWRPLILTRCLPGDHNRSAPCLVGHVPGLVYGEELLYPDFRIRLPSFYDHEHRATWMRCLQYNRKWRRGKIVMGTDQLEGWIYYLGQRGQNLVYEHVSYVGTPVIGVWRDDACMSWRSHEHVTAFPHTPRSDDRPPSEVDAIFVGSPDNNSFQHFLDRVALMLAQTAHLAQGRGEPDWKYVASRAERGGSPVRELWSLLVPGFGADTHLLQPGTWGAKELYEEFMGDQPLGYERPKPGADFRYFVYPCQTPLIHPYLHQLPSEIMIRAAGVDPAAVKPPRERKVVAFFVREGSRRWHNEAQCVAAVRSLLRRRRRGEVLEAFRAENVTSIAAVIRHMARYKLVVGAHGGAMANIAFLQPGTAVVEICPVRRYTNRAGVMYYEAAAVRNLPYWAVMATNTTADFEILHQPCTPVKWAVRDALERQDAGLAPVLEPFSQGVTFNRR
ncbi:hypothetical protein HYH03_015056 [Edaphochlamys debaryana]|uniref:Glycosyltransferase 61 catalytic domain-containing protein n=1 Tax=Edaphochlamys debaryana TaxID=47281 RepID=A0A835XQ60_9CHLO|nr:hypothetical protein HYH03_015056 [Edaphochlamys debaryana]|eukprot:KAG2486231.1 hypothetical protein HYH03_015056 [Edaphochlamys debaryana]